MNGSVINNTDYNVVAWVNNHGNLSDGTYWEDSHLLLIYANSNSNPNIDIDYVRSPFSGNWFKIRDFATCTINPSPEGVDDSVIGVRMATAEELKSIANSLVIQQHRIFVENKSHQLLYPNLNLPGDYVPAGSTRSA